MPEIVTIEPYRRLVVVRCRGNLDLAVRHELRRAVSFLPNRDADTVIMDLSDVPFMDCAALSVVLLLARNCARADVGFTLAGATPMVRRLLSTLDLDNVLVLMASVSDAKALARRWAAQGCDSTPRSSSALLPPPQRLPSTER